MLVYSSQYFLAYVSIRKYVYLITYSTLRSNCLFVIYLDVHWLLI